MCYYILILHYSLLMSQFDGAQIVYKTTNIECSASKNLVENYTCSLKAKNWNKAVIQMVWHLKCPIRNVSVHMELFPKGYNNAYQPFLINVQFNICDVLSKKNYFQYGVIVAKVLQQFSNVNHSCPLEGSLIARNMYIQDQLFPAFPLGAYLFSFSTFENHAKQPKASIGVIKIFVQVMEMIESKRKPRV
ncbi:hypothetical protein KR215_009808 [Drosophila sulfurigaster]|nr:hypothetical protein KR215_009808 [Drosophila sulfurigaster]